jgi:hypothetical protein
MPKISIEQIRTANQKLMAGKGGSVKSYASKLSQYDINEMLKKAFHSLPQ